MRIHHGLLLVCLLFAACDGDSPTSPGDTPLAFETVVKASSSGFFEPVRGTVRTAEEWDRVWQTLHAGLSPMPTLPAIDFDREMVVLAAAGTRSNGCFALDITDARRRRSGAVEFEVTETVPGPTCACTEALTQPAHVVKVPRVSGPEVFIERRSQRRC